MDLNDLHVLVPNTFGGLDVCSVADLVMRFDDPDNEDRDPDEVLGDAAIDSIKATPEHVARVRRLNETGDANAYWNLT